MATIGIRREDKNRWERRAPLTPEHVGRLIREHGLRVVVQPSDLRVYGDEEYSQQGAEIREDLSDCPVIFGIKEIPAGGFQADTAYVFFSHTIKGQAYNMDMLKRLLEMGCTLIDYEPVVDARGRRLIFFGRFAGLAGMIDTLWTLGRRYRLRGTPNGFSDIKRAYDYADLEAAKESIRLAGEKIKQEGLTGHRGPFISGFTGYGNVSKGAQEIYRQLGVTTIPPEALKTVAESGGHGLYLVEFKEADMVAPKTAGAPFNLQEYYEHPERYSSTFTSYAPYLDTLVNGIYWTERYPRLLSKAYLKEIFTGRTARLQVIGDISCDVDGAIGATVKATTPGEPSFVYNPATESISGDLGADGIAVMAVDNLPCELPREASEFFSTALLPYVAEIAGGDYHSTLEESGLSNTIQQAVIAYRGKLTSKYAYIEELW